MSWIAFGIERYPEGLKRPLYAVTAGADTDVAWTLRLEKDA